MYNASRVIGNVVEVDSGTFLNILQGKESGFVITAKVGFLKKKYQYQFYHNGLIFYTEVFEPLKIPDSVSIVMAKKIYTPIVMVPNV